MLPPILKILLKQPKLVALHVHNYLDLFKTETRATLAHAIRSAICWVIVGASALLFLIFTGVAIMVGALVGHMHWALVLVPLAALLTGVAAWVMAKRPAARSAWTEITQQFTADMQALRNTGARHDG